MALQSNFFFWKILELNAKHQNQSYIKIQVGKKEVILWLISVDLVFSSSGNDCATTRYNYHDFSHFRHVMLFLLWKEFHLALALAMSNRIVFYPIFWIKLYPFLRIEFYPFFIWIEIYPSFEYNFIHFLG